MVYDIGKPLVIAELSPINCNIEEMNQFIDESKSITQGWISFYWGKTIEEYEQRTKFSAAIMKAWLEYYRDKRKIILQHDVGKNKMKGKLQDNKLNDFPVDFNGFRPLEKLKCN